MKLLKIGLAILLVVVLISAITAMSGAQGTGVKQVSVSGNVTELLPDDTINLTATVLTGNTTESWTGNITVTQPDTDSDQIAISGTGTTTDAEVYPGTFGGTASTTATGTYTVSVSVEVAGETAVTANTTFVVKSYLLSASPTRTTEGANTTISVATNVGSWTGTVWVYDPGAGNNTASANNTDTDVVYPDDFSGGDTDTAGVYQMGLIVSAAEQDTGTFDIQNASPHAGTFVSTTDACAACHQTHTAVGSKLLTSSTQYNLCTSCHDGTGANTKVTDGIYLGSTEGTQNAGLRAGGFTKTTMDTDVDGSLSSANITSKHSIGATSPVVWGSGALGSNDAGETISSLECGSCHNPHGNSNYRILRPKPLGLVTDAPASGVSVPDESTTTYSISDDGSNYRDLGKYPTGVLSSVTEWCGQCHERYEAGTGSGSTARGDTVYAYSHMTDGLGGECFKCHVAHGTSASMSNYAAGPIWPANTTASWQQTNEGEYSRLLHIDNRGVCIQCHSSTELTQN
jgi:predicted CXXCH cytochrome family protein